MTFVILRKLMRRTFIVIIQYETSTSSIQKYDRGKAINRTKIFRPLAVARHFLLFAITDHSVYAVFEVMFISER